MIEPDDSALAAARARVAPQLQRMEATTRLRERWWWWVAYGKPDCEALDTYVEAAIPVELNEPKCTDYTCSVCAWRSEDHTSDEHKHKVEQRRAELHARLLAKHTRIVNGIRVTFPSWDVVLVERFRHRIERGRRLCEVHPPAIDGNGGSTTCFKLAVALVRGLVLDNSIAVELLWDVYNTRCIDVAGHPSPWSWDELVHKVTDADEKSDLRWGYLLDEVRGRAAVIEREPGETGAEECDTDPCDTEAVDKDECDKHGCDTNDPKGSPTGAPRNTTTSPPTPNGSGSHLPQNLATVMILGMRGYITTTDRHDIDKIILRVLDGPFAGRERALQLDWPPTNRSRNKWHYLAVAAGLDEIRDPRAQLRGRRVAVELIPAARFGFTFGKFYPVPQEA